MNQELQDVQTRFRAGRGIRHQIPNICQIIEQARELQETIDFCCIDFVNAFDSVDLCKLWEILQEMGIPGQRTCLLRNLYAGQETAVIMGHGRTVWVQIGKGVYQSCILSP